MRIGKKDVRARRLTGFAQMTGGVIRNNSARADDLRVDVRPASHESARWSEASLARARPAASRVLCGQGEVAVDLFDQLVLHDEVHRDRRADRSDRDGRRDQEGDPKTEAHGSFIT